MINKTAGHIILKGGTSEELRKAIPELELTEEFFCNLGYKASTAKRYLRRLRKNDEQKDKEIAQEELAKQAREPEQPKQPKPVDILGEMFIKSEEADSKNLLADTCALGNKETLELIEKAKQVTFIYSIIEEMDKKNMKTKPKLFSNIGKYCSKILQEPEKYMLSTFSGLRDEKYPDNVLLQYLLILPKQIRPTLLTADKKLAVKAATWNLPYILFDVSIAKKVDSSAEEYRIKLGFGIYEVKNKDGSTYIENRGTYKFDVIHSDGSHTSYKKGHGQIANVKLGDKVCVYQKQKNITVSRVLKLQLTV